MKYQTRLVIILIVGASILLLSSITMIGSAQDAEPTPSDYVDLQFTEIRGLTTEQIEGYRAGSGLGYALPAELNGYPGSRHVLDHADELDITDAQLTEIQALYDTMLPQAIALGEEFLAQEEAIELAFRDSSVTNESLLTDITESARIEAELRYVHLSTHLALINILTAEQIQQYNVLRGYATSESSEHDGHQG